MGEEGKGGGQSGDLYLKVQVKKPWLRRIKELLLERRGSGFPFPLTFLRKSRFDHTDVAKCRGDFFLNLTLPKIQEKMYI